MGQDDVDADRVVAALQKIYRKKLRPIEESFLFGRFHYDAITDSELQAKSQVLVIGQYSTGKTTFIRHLLGADFPNMNIGPEPTTDKFTVVMHGEDDRPVEGNSLAMIKELPYEGLTRFGTGFLNKLDAAVSTSYFLEDITLIDTPGVLSGEMQRHQRAYDFADVARWFADRSDMILLLFDAHRLDVSDELMEILGRLKDHQHKIRIVLNKADQVDKPKLMRVYGALMWSMGKVFDNPEVVRVYIGSFWDQPLQHPGHERLFVADQDALLRELLDLPRLAAIRKINELIKRTKLLRAHVCVLSYLREQMPFMYGKSKKREELLDNMDDVLRTVKIKYGLHEGDIPDGDALATKLRMFDFCDFPTAKQTTLRRLSDVIEIDIQKAMSQGGGSEKIFRFTSLRGASSSSRGFLSQAGSSVRHLFGGGNADYKSRNTSTKRLQSSRHRSSFETVESGHVRRGTGISGEVVDNDLATNDATRPSAVEHPGSKATAPITGCTCCGLLKVAIFILVPAFLLLLVMEPVLVSSPGPLRATVEQVGNQARQLGEEGIRRTERLLAQAETTTSECGGASSEGRVSRGSSNWNGQTRVTGQDELEAMYKGVIH